MSSESKTPNEETAASPTREITISVPAERVEQFEAFVERFLSGEGGPRRRRGYRGPGSPAGPSGPGGPGAHRHGPGREGHRGDRRERHLRRALFHLAMAQGGSELRHGRCGRRGERSPSTDPASAVTL